MSMQFTTPTPPYYMVPPRMITQDMCYVYLPTPESLVQHLVDTAKRLEELELENELLQSKLDREREEHAKEVAKLKNKVSVECALEEVVALRSAFKSHVDELQTRLDAVQKDVNATLGDPRIKEVDKKLSKLGREIKKAEGSNRIVMELQRENEILHEDVENANMLIKGFKSSDTEIKKLKAKLGDVQKQSEHENKRYEAAIASLQGDIRTMAATIMKQNAENCHLREVIFQLGRLSQEGCSPAE